MKTDASIPRRFDNLQDFVTLLERRARLKRISQPVSLVYDVTEIHRRVLAEEGLSLGEHHPRTIDELEDDYFDLIVTLAPQAHHAALELTRSMAVEVEYWPMPDPTSAMGTREQIMAAYREVRERLKARIAERFGQDRIRAE